MHHLNSQRAWGRRETCTQSCWCRPHPLGRQRRQQLGDAGHVAGVGGCQAARSVQQRRHQGLPGCYDVPCQQRRRKGGGARCGIGVRLLTPRQRPLAAPKRHLHNIIADCTSVFRADVNKQCIATLQHIQ